MPWSCRVSVTVLCFLFTIYLTNGTPAETDTTTLSPQSRMKDASTSMGTSRSLNPTSTTVSGSSGNSVSEREKSLDDLSLDDIPAIRSSAGNSSMCQGKYSIGETFSTNCEKRCKCVMGGKVICEPRCQTPFIRKGLRLDPLCEEKPSPDECCVVLACPQEGEQSSTTSSVPASPVPDSGVMCKHKNESFQVGATWNDGCESVCVCGSGGATECRPRCPVANTTHVKDGCVSLPDHSDPCCMVVLCDVTLAEHDEPKSASMEASDELRLSSADAVNATAAIVHFVGEPMLDANLMAETSKDGEKWVSVPIDGGIVGGLPAGQNVQIRVVSGSRRSNAVTVSLPELQHLLSNATEANNSSTAPMPKAVDEVLQFCTFNGHNYSIGQEFNDECISFCTCTETGVSCLPIECPIEYGLDVLDPTCLQWETKPRDFTPKAPNCCSDKVRCLDNGSCLYKGQTIPNYAEVPTNLTGCEQKCYCEIGNVTCQDLCEPTPASPPTTLPCPANVAFVHTELHPDGSCCPFWACPANVSKPHPDVNKISNGPNIPTHNVLDGEPTKSSFLPGPVRIPDSSSIPDPAHLPGPPYGVQQSLQDFLANKDEGIHGPPPFVVKPTKEDIKKQLLEKGQKGNKIVIEEGNDDDLGPLVGPFPLHPPLVGDVYVSQPQNKPLPPTNPSGIFHHHHPIPSNAPPAQHDLPFFHFLPNHYEEPITPTKDHLHIPNHVNSTAHQPGAGVVVNMWEPLDERTIRLAFSVPLVLVGLYGRFEVRYTAHENAEDPLTWERQVLAPPGDLIATAQLHFDLGNLLPDTTYRIFIKVILREISNAVESPIITVRTPPGGELTTLPPQIPIDPVLSTSDVNATWVSLRWRKFSDFELQFIDGLQLRYRERDRKVFSTTPLIHRAVTSYTVLDLKPNTSYEVGLDFIPFPEQTTELKAENLINFVTSLENDPYKFDIQLDIVAIKSTVVEVTWTGVPYPEDKFVNIYRVHYQSEGGKEDFNTFKDAKRESTPKITVQDLKPTTRYRLWLEAYLTNGRTKKSNVQDFVTKPGVLSAGHSLSGKLAGVSPVAENGDYYGPLVAVAVLAALAIMAALILLLVLMRKHSQNKAPITARKSESAYDNPSYKTSENDTPSNGNGVVHSEADTTTIP